MNTFSDSERNELRQKLITLMDSKGLDGILLADPDNFTYATGVDLPYAEQYPHKVIFYFLAKKGDIESVVCEPDWVDLIRDQGYEGEILPYTFERIGSYINLLKAISGILKKALPADAIVGVDDDLWCQSLYESIRGMDGHQFIPITKDISSLRMVKTSAEIRQLEEACRISDRAYISALNHSEGNVHDPLGYDLWEFAERIRVHVGEFGGSGTGNVTCLQGDELHLFYQPPQGIFNSGNLIRAEITNHHRGYWSSGCRTLIVGQPSEGQYENYQAYIELTKKASEWLKPGSKCSDIYHQIKEYAEDEGLHLLKGCGFGHGIGTSEREAPYISPDDNTVLQEGMVIVISIYIQTGHGEVICSKDTYEVTGDGSRLLNWYKNWDSLYRLVGNSARHG